MTDKLYWYWFCSMLGINSRRQHQLMEIFLHPRELFAASPNIIEETLSKKAYQRFMETRSPDQIRRSYEALEKVLPEAKVYIDTSEDGSTQKLLPIESFVKEEAAQ